MVTLALDQNLNKNVKIKLRTGGKQEGRLTKEGETYMLDGKPITPGNLVSVQKKG